MKHFLLPALSIGLFSITTVCMEKKDTSIMVKLAEDQSFHHLHRSIAARSCVIYEKLQWKKHFENHSHYPPLNPEKPIVLHNVSSSDFHLFQEAACISKDNFKKYYKGLSAEKQRDLILLSGPEKLYDPQLITYLVPEYLKDIEQIVLSFMSTEEIAEYMKKNIFMHNLNVPEISGFGIGRRSQCNLVFHPHGTFHAIPAQFQTTTSCTTMGTSALRFMYFKKNNQQAGETYLIRDTKKIDLCRYHITYDKETVRFWEIKNVPENEDDSWTYNENPDISCKMYHSKRAPEIYFCPNNQCAFLVVTENNILKTILIPTQTSEETHIKNYLPDSLENRFDAPKFNNNATMFALLSNTLSQSQLLLYDIPTGRHRIIPFNHPMGSHFCFNNTDTRLYVAIMAPNNPHILVYNIEDTDLLYNQEIDIKPLTVVAITDDCEYPDKNSLNKITALTYDKKRNQVIVLTAYGSLTCISEPIEGIMEKVILNHPYPCENPLYYGSLFFLDTHDILLACPYYIPSITFWDLTSNKYIGEKEITIPRKTGLRHVAIAGDECSLATFNGFASSWKQQILWTPEEQATIKFIKNPQGLSLFQAYTLHRLYLAHKNQHEITLHAKNWATLFLNSLPSAPHGLKECMREYLITERSNVNLIQEFTDRMAERTIETVDEFVTSTIIPFTQEAMASTTQIMNGVLSWFQ